MNLSFFNLFATVTFCISLASQFSLSAQAVESQSGMDPSDTQAVSQTLQDYFYARSEGPEAQLRAANAVRKTMMSVQQHYGEVLAFDPSKLQDRDLERHLNSLVPKEPHQSFATGALPEASKSAFADPVQNCAKLVTEICSVKPIAASISSDGQTRMQTQAAAAASSVKRLSLTTK